MTLRDRIAMVACNATAAGKLFPWDQLSDVHRQAWYDVADAIIRELGLPPNWGKPSFDNGSRNE